MQLQLCNLSRLKNKSSKFYKKNFISPILKFLWLCFFSWTQCICVCTIKCTCFRAFCRQQPIFLFMPGTTACVVITPHRLWSYDLWRDRNLYITIIIIIVTSNNSPLVRRKCLTPWRVVLSATEWQMVRAAAVVVVALVSNSSFSRALTYL